MNPASWWEKTVSDWLPKGKGGQGRALPAPAVVS